MILFSDAGGQRLSQQKGILQAAALMERKE